MFKMTSSSFSHHFESWSRWTANFSDKSSTLPSAEIESYIQLFCGGLQVPNTCLFVCWVLALAQNISHQSRLLVKKRNQDHAKGTIWQPLVWFAFVLKSELLLSLEHRPSISTLFLKWTISYQQTYPNLVMLLWDGLSCFHQRNLLQPRHLLEGYFRLVLVLGHQYHHS